MRTLPLILLALAGCGGTKLEPVSERAERNQQTAAVMIESLTDSGTVQSLAESIYCSAGGNLQRAGLAGGDAGVPCPAQK